MPTRTQELEAELVAILTPIRDLAKAAEDARRDFTDDERAQITQATARATDIKKRVEAIKGDNALRDVISSLGEGIGLNDADAERKNRQQQLQGPGLIGHTSGKSLGQFFTESVSYKELLATVPGGHFTKEHRVQGRPVGYEQLLRPSLAAQGQKTLVTGLSDTSAGAYVINDFLGQQVGLDAFVRPLRLRDLVTPGRTISDTVEYVRLTSVTNNAAPVAEATATAGSSGTKPESALVLAKVTTPVRTIAHWIPVTKRALSDAAQIMTLIDAFLEYGLEEEVEDQMVAGDGTGENFTGLANTSGVQTQAWDTNALVTLRKAKTKVRLVGRSIPTGYLIHPTDMETLDLLSDNEARFYFGGPSGTIQVGDASPIWNLPAIETEAVSQGTAWVGDWRKCVLWDREQSSITMTDSHADFFVRNMVAILAELRAAFGILQPNAFVSIDLTP